MVLLVNDLFMALFGELQRMAVGPTGALAAINYPIHAMTSARDPMFLWHLGGSLWEETSGRRYLRRHLGEAIWEETSEERHLGRAIGDDPGKTWHHLGSIGNRL